MDRQFYLGGKLKNVAVVDDVVAVKGPDEGVRGLLGADEGAEAAREAVRAVAPDVDEEALAALQNAGWDLLRATDGLADAREAGDAPVASENVGTLVVGRGGRPAIATNLLTVQLAGDPDDAQVEATFADTGLVRINTLRFAPHLYEVRSTQTDALDASVALTGDPRFVFAEPALIEFVPGRHTPGDPGFGDQWQWANSGAGGGTAGADVHAEEAWDHTRGAGIRIAVIDNGFDADHEDLTAGVGPASGFFVAGGGGGAATFTIGVGGMPASDHGTFCAGMAAAREGNGLGGVGGAPEAELTLIAALGDQVGTQVTLARAIAYAADPSTEGGASAGADIIVSSLGPNGAVWDLTTVLDLALQAAAANGRGGLGCAIFWAASNGNNVDVMQDEVVSHADVIAVVRSDRNDLEDNAARGAEVELIAPGVDVVSTLPNDTYGPSTGTSFAAPCAAAVAALALSVRPAMTRDQLRELMHTTADQIGGVVYDATGHNDDYGFGRVNAHSAVIEAARRITLLSDPIEFIDVPEGETTARAIVWEVESLEDLTFEVTAGPTTTSGPAGSFSLVLGPSTTLTAPGIGANGKARIWIGYTATTAGDTASGTVTAHSVETGESWTIPIVANVVEPPTAAVAMVLDRSGSMGWGAGDGRTRVEVLRDAAHIFAQVLKPDTGIGSVQFDHDANPVMNIIDAGPEIFGAGRAQFAAVVSAHVPNPAGGTSIGDGVVAGATLLDAVAPNFDTTAMVVLTDGQQTAPLYIADVAGTIDDTVFAVGLGEPADVDPISLTALTNGTGGYVQVTGTVSVDEQFVLAKYYLQILAGVSNDQIVLDPDGYVAPGHTVKVPFAITTADRATDVILLSPAPSVLDFTLVSPTGVVVTPASAGVTFVQDAQVAFYRFTLPLLDPATATSSHEGEWTALLEVDERRFRKYLAELERTDIKMFEIVSQKGVRYLLEVHSTSSLRFDATLQQDGIAPGSTFRLTATLSEIGIPVGAAAADVRAEIITPFGPDTATLTPSGDGEWSTDFLAARNGLYRVRVLAEGKTLRGEPFTREKLLSGSIYTPGKPNDGDGGDDEDCDHTIEIFMDTVRGNARLAKMIDAALQRNGSSLTALLKCLGRRRGTSEREDSSDAASALADALRAAADALGGA